MELFSIFSQLYNNLKVATNLCIADYLVMSLDVNSAPFDPFQKFHERLAYIRKEFRHSSVVFKKLIANKTKKCLKPHLPKKCSSKSPPIIIRP